MPIRSVPSDVNAKAPRRPRPAQPKADGDYHHGNLRRALLDVAATIIEESGPLAFSMRDAAKRLGVDHRAAYRHFEDRDAVLAAVAEEGYRELGTQVERELALYTDADAIERASPRHRARVRGLRREEPGTLPAVVWGNVATSPAVVTKNSFTRLFWGVDTVPGRRSAYRVGRSDSRMTGMADGASLAGMVTIAVHAPAAPLLDVNRRKARATLVGHMRFVLPDQVLKQLRAWREERRRIDIERKPICPCCDEDEREACERVSSIEVEYDAVYLHGIPFFHFLTSDGRVLVVEKDEQGWSPVRETSGKESFRAIAYAAQIAEADVPQLGGVTGILDLLPKVPSNATTCMHCEGSRFVRGWVCGSCYGLGWTIPSPSDSERLCNAVREFMRALRG